MRSPPTCRRLKAAPPGSQEWADLVAFLQELCGLTKTLQATQRNSLLLRLVSLGLFQVGGWAPALALRGASQQGGMPAAAVPGPCLVVHA